MPGDNDAPPPEVPPTPTPAPGLTTEEILKQLADTNRRLEAVMEINRSQGEKLEAIVSRQPRAPQTLAGDDIELEAGFAEKYGISDESAKALIGAAVRVGERRVMNQMQFQESLREIRDNFYKDNVDLVPHKTLIQSIANDLQQQNPTMKLGEALAETAKRARAYIKDIQDKVPGKETPPPPPVVPGGGNRDGVGNGNPSNDPQTPEDVLGDEMKTRREARAKAGKA